MQRTERDGLETVLEEMWSEHREYLRRLLISLTYDIDLADDLLQETFLKARGGLTGYRGGDARAWLSTIAKRLLYSHVRNRWVRSELPLADRETEQEDGWLGSPPYLNTLVLRQAIDSLAQDQRIALIMKHYGGFTYKEIGKHLGCPTGTVQRRVWTATQRLRAALAVSQKELAGMSCRELRGITMLDYVYGALPPDESAAVRAHLDECAECRREVEELRALMAALDTIDEEYKSTNIIELDEKGQRTVYYSLSQPNPYDKPMDTVEFGAGNHTELLHVFMQGEEVQLELLPELLWGRQPQYRAHLTRPIEPGVRLETQFVFREPPEPEAHLGDGRWQSKGRWELTEKAVAFLAVRLPCGARFVRGVPEPDEVRTDGLTTVLWRRMMQPNEPLEITCEYTL